MSSLKIRCLCLAFLMPAILACSFVPGQDTAPRHLEPSAVLNVAIEPQPAMVHVNVSYRRGRETTVTLTCKRPGEEGQLVQIYYVDDREVTADDGVTRNHSFDFVLKKPGNYQVTCQIDNSTRNASFTIAEPAATTASQAAPAQTDPTSSTSSQGSQASALGPFTSGQMWFEFARATSRGPSFHLLQGCLPGLQLTDTATTHYGETSFKVALDGAFTGRCTASLATDSGTLDTKSQLTQGQWTADGQVTFRLETAVTLNVKEGTSTTNLVWIGTGQFITPTVASGTATWQGTCQGNVACSYKEDSGTVPWVITFNP